MMMSKWAMGVTVLLAPCLLGGSCYEPPPCVAPLVKAQKYLLVYANGGVSNRLKALAASYAMAKITGRKLIVDWHIEPNEVPAEFEDLFENPIPRPETMVLPENWSIEDLYQNKIQCPAVVTRLKYDINSYLDYTNIPQITSQIVVVNTRFVYAAASQYASFDKYLDDVVEFLKDLKPVPQIKTKVEEYANANFQGASVVGVHYRAWSLTYDGGLQAKANPETFLAKMREIAQKDSHVKFFVTSDSLQIANFFRDQMPGRILTYPLSNIDRSSVQSQRNSLLEWYLLSKTDYLIGTFDSSFSETASLLTKQRRNIAIGPKVWVNIGDMYCFDANGRAVARDLSCAEACCENHYL
jgi:hypothetical protein